MGYDEEGAEAEAAAARDVTAKPRATKKIVAPKSTNLTPINRQSEGDNKDDEPAERSATRHSKRLLVRENVLGGENVALLPPWGPADLLLHYTYLSRVSLPGQTFYSLRQGENSCAVDVCIVLGHDFPLEIFFFFTTNY